MRLADAQREILEQQVADYQRQVVEMQRALDDERARVLELDAERGRLVRESRALEDRLDLQVEEVLTLRRDMYTLSTK